MAHTPALTDLELILLSTAAARADGNLFPLKSSIADKRDAIAAAIATLLDSGLIAEQPETVRVRVWREDGDARTGLVVTEAGQALIDGGPVEDRDAGGDGSDRDAGGDAAADATEAAPRRAGSKIATVLGLLRRPEGATPAELIAATGWLPHTMRAALTGLRRKGHAIERGKRGTDTVYAIAAGVGA